MNGMELEIHRTFCISQQTECLLGMHVQLQCSLFNGMTRGMTPAESFIMILYH